MSVLALFRSIPVYPPQIRVSPTATARADKRCMLRDGREVAIRSAGAHDAARIQDFIRKLAPRTRYYRFCGTTRELPVDALARLVQADGECAVTLLALAYDTNEVLGLGEYIAQRKANTCEMALVVHDTWQRAGLGSLLLSGLMSRAREASLHYMEGLVLRDNSAMLKLARAQGFEMRASAHDSAMVHVRAAVHAEQFAPSPP
jgi:acetyltransferase